MTFKIDRTAELALLKRYEPASVTKIMAEAARIGGIASAQVVKSATPIGTAERLSQYYRRMNLRHGTLRASVRAAKIRSRATIGQVVGPIGSKAFTRGWVELRTGWTAHVASSALTVAERASEAVLERYARL